MMCKPLFIIILILVSLAAYSQKNDNIFFEKLLNDFSKNSYFILVKSDSQNKSTYYLIENDDLYYFFHETKGLDKTEYQKFMIPLLKYHKSIYLSNKDIFKFGFIKLTKNEHLGGKATIDKDAFVDNFFKGRVLKEGLSVEEKNYIVQVLFYWQIAAKIDDESGFLIIDK